MFTIGPFVEPLPVYEPKDEYSDFSAKQYAILVFGTPFVYEGLNTVQFTVLNKFVAVSWLAVVNLKY